MTYTMLVVGSATIANLLLAAMFAARVVAPSVAQSLGFAGTAMALPAAGASLIAARTGRPGWDIALPLVFVAFAAVEVLADAVLRSEFRTTAWLWPYLVLFYAGQWALIGAAFRASSLGGFVVLASYFVCLAATAYSYNRVGHGLP
jgi:hypothetical protein